MASSHYGTCPPDLLQGLVVGISPLVCADLQVVAHDFFSENKLCDPSQQSTHGGFQSWGYVKST